MWPASASSARLPVQRPATNSTTIMTLVSASVTASMGRERAAAVLRSWPCASIGGIVSGRCARPGDRIRAMARALGIVALGIVGFWLVAHLLWMGPVEAAAQTTVMWVLGLLTGGVGVAAIVLLALALSVGGSQPALLKFARGARNAAAVLGCALIIVGDRKSTRLNSSHVAISYAVFCLKKKKKARTTLDTRLPDTI